MFTIKTVYEDHDDVISAARYVQRGQVISAYYPRFDAAYVLPGHCVQEIDLSAPGLVNVFVMNAMGKTVERIGPRDPRPL